MMRSDDFDIGADITVALLPILDSNSNADRADRAEANRRGDRPR